MELPYRPGLHLLATLKTTVPERLYQSEAFRKLATELVERHQLQSLGTVYHDFPTGGFTGVVCLSESHFSIHTWPEHNLANVDVYLSNYERTNDGTVRKLFEAICEHLSAEVISKTELFR
ncbi:MAG: S-adenosylmethionine decarboxylase [Sphingobacteriales bacterium]|nr:MAG: S-adenosylmethionine decarboxylase [Sphingobacteriales bacterium]